MKNFLLLFLCASFLYSCLNDKNSTKVAGAGEFDSGDYFKKEAVRLNAAKSGVIKSATRNGHSETKVFDHPDWQQELALFSQSLINKPSWKGKYLRRSKPGETLWYTRDPDLYTRAIRILTSPEGRIKEIRISNRSDNTLYTSSEELTYYPDSLYEIVKTQQVRLMGVNHYFVTGKIKK